jgi:hypothetical protein
MVAGAAAASERHSVMPPKPHPPEPRAVHAYLHLQMEAMIFLRSRSGDLSREQIGDLADALHTLPEFIWPGLWPDAEFRRLYLEPYDRRWADPPESPSLVALLDEGFRRSAST